MGAYDADGFTYELEEGAPCAASQVPAGAFAYVPQDNFLFAGTVRENVAFAAPDANGDQVRHACEAACAWDFVKELPLGIDTAIGEHGLSQGQLQRLAIAHAVCSGAPIMVLDEVTSALDGKTEADVLGIIAALPGRTAFVAAHRAKAREFATMRLRVDGGVVSAEGFVVGATDWESRLDLANERDVHVHQKVVAPFVIECVVAVHEVDDDASASALDEVDRHPGIAVVENVVRLVEERPYDAAVLLSVARQLDAVEY